MNKQIDIKKSQLIFNELTKGEIINEYIYDNKNNSLSRNDLFTEISENIEVYKMQYEMCGFQLVHNPTFFYVRDKNSSKTSDKQSKKIKIYSSLLIIVRYILSDKGKLFDILKNIHYGITAEDLKDIENNSNYTHILKASNLKNGEEILNYLYSKNIFLKTNKDKYILSDSGKEIVNDIMIQYS